MYFYLKAIHLIGMVVWFAGLFYLVRLFIYDTEALARASPEREILHRQFGIMQKRLMYIITWPGMAITLICGSGMLIINPAFLQDRWMHVKLTFIAVLLAYHFYCEILMRRLHKEQVSISSAGLRVFNEIATLILVGVVFLAVFRNNVDYLYGMLGLLGLGIVLMLGIKLYRKLRNDS